MSEIWKPIPHEAFKDTYEISNYGLVRLKKTKEIKPRNIRSAYLNFKINPIVNGNRGIANVKIHRMVALAFIKNDDPKHKTWVNHINGDKYDVRVSNLEWITPPGNVQHAIDTGLIKVKKSPVIQYDLKTGETIEEYDSITEASDETGISSGHIASVCTGDLEHARGFGFRFANEDPDHQKNVDLSKFKQIDKFPNYVINKEGKIYSISHKRFMKTQTHQEGTKMVQLSNTKEGRKDFLVHRLVGQYFIKKEDPKHNSIRHIDRDKTNNHIDNLIWCYVGGIGQLDSKYKTPYYDPKTAVKPPKRKMKADGPKDLLTADPHKLSRNQCAERKLLLKKQKLKKSRPKRRSGNISGSKTSKKSKKKEASKSQKKPKKNIKKRKINIEDDE